MTDRSQSRRRLDVALVERGLAESRARAQEMITSGGVSVDDAVAKHPAMIVGEEARIALVRPPLPYVSRGGLKLSHALDAFAVSVEGAVALDVGASTGGFTDVLLQAGATRVYAVDVGYGQLAWKLRADPRVTLMERTNIRDIIRLPETIDVATADVSFISLRFVLPTVKRLLRPDGDLICLIKPQFEAGPESVGKKGVVRDPEVWRSVLEDILAFGIGNGWVVRGLVRSPVTGPAGNVEFLVHFSLDRSQSGVDIEPAIRRVIEGG